MIKTKNVDPSANLAVSQVALADAKLMIGNASGVGAAQTPSGDVTITNAGVTVIGATKVTDAMLAGSISQAKLTAASLDGTVAKVVANVNVIGGIPVVHRIDIADATANTDVTLTHKTRIIDVVAVKTAANGGAGDQVIVQNGANAITNAISLNAVDTTVVRVGTIDDAQHEIAAAGTLRVAATKATNTACTVYVYGLRVA